MSPCGSRLPACPQHKYVKQTSLTDTRLCLIKFAPLRRFNSVLEPVPTVIVQGMAKEFFQGQLGQQTHPMFAIPTVKTCLSRSRINAAMELSRARFFVDQAELDRNPDVICTADGSILDLHADGRTTGQDLP